MLRIRITFSKTEAMRFTGHLDLHRTWERTVRRARAPLAYSEGFHPHPRIQLGAALPLGITGEREWVDVWLEREVPEDELRASLVKAAPPGIKLIALEPVDLRAPALQTQIVSAEFEAWLPEQTDADTLEKRVAELKAQPEIPRTRRDKAYDLQPLIERLSIGRDDSGQPVLSMTLAAREGATGRPEEVLAALGLTMSEARVRRTRLIIGPG